MAQECRICERVYVMFILYIYVCIYMYIYPFIIKMTAASQSEKGPFNNSILITLITYYTTVSLF